MTTEPNRYVSIDFSYTDEYEEETRLCKVVSNDYLGETQLGVLNELYKSFLLAAGFTYLGDKRIEFVDEI